MDSIISVLKKSDHPLLIAAVRDGAKWMKLRHAKQDLELFLAHNIARIRFKTKSDGKYSEVVCTGNNRLMKVLMAVRNTDKVDLVKTPFVGIKTNDSASVTAYDIESNHLKTISLKSWEILEFVTITEENVLILDAIIRASISKRTAK